MTPSDLLHTLRGAHLLILTAGLLGVLSVLAGLVTRRTGAPVLLVFLAVGMLAGEDGLLGIPFDDYGLAYLAGSVALAVILFEGGLKTPRAAVLRVFWPSAMLATAGVVVTAALVAGALWAVAGVPLGVACLAGAIVAPTDAAAVSSLLRRSGAAVPERLMEVLEVESGLNDPMSVFLTFTLMRVFVTAGGAGLGWEEAAKDFAVEMLGGAAMGLAAGWAMKWALTRLPIEPALANVMALTGALALFGAAQLAGASGFLATYLAGVMVCGLPPARAVDMEGFFDGVGWLAQIGLFLMLGLLVTPHTLGPALPAAALGAGVLIFLARPAAVFACLLPFRFGVREAAFAAWVGLRGGVPIYLAVIPALADPGRHVHLFNMVFMVVVASLIVQGWTVAVVARGLGFGRT